MSARVSPTVGSATCNSRIFIFALWWFALFLPGCLFADFREESRLVPLPNDSEFANHVVRTNKILQALFLEKHQRYPEARRIWKSLPERYQSVQDHVFQAELMSLVSTAYPNVPQTKNSLLLASKYLRWRKKWAEALKLLDNYRKHLDYDLELRLEMVRLTLDLGRYQRAESLLSSMPPIRGREKLRYEMLWGWYYILRGNEREAQKIMVKIEEDFLYLPFSAILPEGGYFSVSDSEKRLFQALIRFPSDRGLFEEAIRVFRRKEEWWELERLIRSQRYLSDEVPAWTLMAEIYLETNQGEKLNRLLKSIDNVERKPEFHDLVARKAIKDENWDLLERVARRYQERFPEVLDGRLYLAEYYQHTGQMEKGRKILVEIGVVGE
ncbi:MAG: hypothetical protein GY866_21405 [Proteobacteria bacterium]|nr:hypothetical protein [Pseudomonadota bacterium]